MPRNLARAAIVSITVVLCLVATPLSAAADGTQFGISGYEISPGFRVGSVTYGVAFAGWTNALNSPWVASSGGDGGSWATVTNYTGTAGISASVFGGYWRRVTSTGVVSFGRVLSGTVSWPGLSGDNGCGVGVASFLIAISRGYSVSPTGAIAGCLDDTHIPIVFPPRIWGTVTLN